MPKPTSGPEEARTQDQPEAPLLTLTGRAYSDLVLIRNQIMVALLGQGSCESEAEAADRVELIVYLDSFKYDAATDQAFILSYAEPVEDSTTDEPIAIREPVPLDRLEAENQSLEDTLKRIHAIEAGPFLPPDLQSTSDIEL